MSFPLAQNLNEEKLIFPHLGERSAVYEGQCLHRGCDRLDILAFSHTSRKTEGWHCLRQKRLEQNSWTGLYGPVCS